MKSVLCLSGCCERLLFTKERILWSSITVVFQDAQAFLGSEVPSALFFPSMHYNVGLAIPKISARSLMDFLFLSASGWSVSPSLRAPLTTCCVFTTSKCKRHNSWPSNCKSLSHICPKICPNICPYNCPYICSVYRLSCRWKWAKGDTSKVLGSCWPSKAKRFMYIFYRCLTAGSKQHVSLS